MRTRGILCILLAMLCWAPAAWATSYAIDQDHTTVSFKIRHLFSYVRGTFNQFEGTVEYVPGEPFQWSTQATIQAASIDTRVEERDKHLRSKDFFHVEQFPTLEFVSNEVTDVVGNTAKLHGLLTIHGVQRPVVFDLVIHGEGNDPWGTLRSGYTATTTVNRKDFGLKWNEVLETGQLLVGEEVEITLDVEAMVTE